MLTQIRKNTRKESERRIKDRRQVEFEFGSPQWIAEVKKNYVAWPKTDRRESTRRDGERRTKNSGKPQNLTHDYSSDLLTEEEWLYFNHLFMKDPDNK